MELAVQHPFNYAYPIQVDKDHAAVSNAYDWVAKHFGSADPQPSVLVVNHDHMQHAARKVNGYDNASGVVYGWFSQSHRQVYVSDKLKPGTHKHHAAVLVHEFTHYAQTCRGDEGTREELESEADRIMMNFMLDC